MKEAIIYGGAFNPPTIAHKAILEACIKEAAKREAEVWLLPSGSRADKSIGGNIERRISLTEALIKSVGATAVSVRTELHELLSQTPTQTFNTHAHFAKKFPDYKQTWVFGADSIITMRQWNNGHQLWNHLAMLVVPRPGIEITELPPQALILPVAPMDISSTAVRACQLNGEPLDALVPPEVVAVLQSV